MNAELEFCQLLSASDCPLLPIGSTVLLRLNNEHRKLMLTKTDEQGKWEVTHNADEANVTITVEGSETQVKSLLQGTDEGVMAAEADEPRITVNPTLVGSGITSEEVTFLGRVYSTSQSIAGRDVSEMFMCGEAEDTAKSYRVFGLMPFQDLTRDHATAQELFDAFRVCYFMGSCASTLLAAYFHRSQIEFQTRIDRIRIFGRLILVARWILGVKVS